MTIYNKLVRDRIPEIIAQREGKPPKTRVLGDDEYRTALQTKLDEEVAEYHQDHTPEELADILEVILALAAVHHLSVQELEELRIKKADKRGGFTKKIFLIET